MNETEVARIEDAMYQCLHGAVNMPVGLILALCTDWRILNAQQNMQHKQDDLYAKILQVIIELEAIAHRDK